MMCYNLLKDNIRGRGHAPRFSHRSDLVRAATRCAFLLCESQPAYRQMNPSSSSTSTLSASPPASVAEKPPRPPFSPKPPAWASASPSLGETASATTFSSAPDTAISGHLHSRRNRFPRRLDHPRKFVVRRPHSRFRLTQEPALLSPRRT